MSPIEAAEKIVNNPGGYTQESLIVAEAYIDSYEEDYIIYLTPEERREVNNQYNKWLMDVYEAFKEGQST